MGSISLQNGSKTYEGFRSMHEFSRSFITALPQHIAGLRIPGRSLCNGERRAPIPVHLSDGIAIRAAMNEVLCDSVTRDAQHCTEDAFAAFLAKDQPDVGVLKYFNGWNEIHRTTSLVSSKVVMRLSADAVCVPPERVNSYNAVMAHMHEVVKDDVGLGHRGHDGMYSHMAKAFGASGWVDSRYTVDECSAFSEFLYRIGVAEHDAALNSAAYLQSMVRAMMVSVASELWNASEYNFLAQYIDEKLLSINPAFEGDESDLRKARSYVMAHSGEVENKHGLHALAALQVFCRHAEIFFDIERLKVVMLDYNRRVGAAFDSLRKVLV